MKKKQIKTWSALFEYKNDIYVMCLFLFEYNTDIYVICLFLYILVYVSYNNFQMFIYLIFVGICSQYNDGWQVEWEETIIVRMVHPKKKQKSRIKLRMRLRGNHISTQKYNYQPTSYSVICPNIVHTITEFTQVLLYGIVGLTRTMGECVFKSRFLCKSFWCWNLKTSHNWRNLQR